MDNQKNKDIPIIKKIKEMLNSFPPIDNSILSLASNPILVLVNESIKEYERVNKPYLEHVRKLFQEHGNYIRSMVEMAQNIQAGFEEFDKKSIQAAIILRKYKWFISPHAPLDFVRVVLEIAADGKRHDKDINKLFLHYYTSHNWSGIENMIKSWGSNKLLKKRCKIIRDCFNAIRLTDNKLNSSNVILPTLIIQIDGSINDFLIEKDLRWDIDGFSRENKKGDVLTGRKSLIKSYKAEFFSDPFFKNVEDIILNYLFQTAFPRKPLERPYGFNRHKILHGENVNYGRKVHLIRAFLILEYLALLP